MEINENKCIRLGFHFHVPAMEKDGQIWMPGYQGRFIDSLAGYCESVVCLLHTPRPDEKCLMDYPLLSRNVTVVGLGEHTSLPKRVMHVHQVNQSVQNARNQMDVMLIRGPSPLLPWIAHAVNPIPISLLLVSDQLAGVNDLPQPRWRKEAIRLFWWWNMSKQRAIAQNCLTFVNSHLLYKQFEHKVPHLEETRTTTLNESDFFYRKDTCQTHPVHLLYTGRMDRSKGILDIIEAVGILTQQGEDLILDLVGMEEKKDPLLKEVFQRSLTLGISERIHYRGYQSLGEELFAFYRQADIYVIASQSSEGFPRTIWEAFSQGTPVIATNVGSIPSYLHHEIDALITEPHAPKELASYIKRLINEPDLRQKLISHGYALAKENTLDRRANELITEIKNWLAH